MHLYVKAVALYAISDRLARNIPHKYAALLGTRSKDDVFVAHAVDIKTNDAGDVDFGHLHKMLQLQLAVSANTQLVGLFCAENADWDGVLAQFQAQQTPPPPLCVTLNGDVEQLQCFDSTSREVVPVTIRPGETEEIATSTVHNHANYSKQETELPQNSDQTLLQSLHQLELLTRAILDNPTGSSDFDRGVVYLANLVRGQRQFQTEDNYELVASQLGLLTNQLAAMNAWDSLFARHLVSQQAKRYTEEGPSYTQRFPYGQKSGEEPTYYDDFRRKTSR